MTRALTSKRKGPAKAGSVVVFLHGYGADGADLLGLADPLAPHLPGTAFHAPDAPEPCANNPMGRQWFPIPWLDGSTEAQARAALDDWLKGLWFAPSGLVRYARRGRRMQGVYSPFWTFDADTRSRYRGLRGDHYFETVYVTRQVNGRTQQVPQQVMRTRWTRAAGSVARRFNEAFTYRWERVIAKNLELDAPYR